MLVQLKILESLTKHPDFCVQMYL